MMNSQSLSRGIEIYRNHGLKQLLVASYSHFGNECRNEKKRVLWRYYHLLGYDRRCDFDTSKITPVTVDPERIRWKVNLPRYWSGDKEYLPVYGDNAIVGELAGWWDKFRKSIQEGEIYERYAEAIANETVDELPRAEMLRSMREQYKSQHELGDDKAVRIRDTEIPDEPRLAVGRNDEFMRWTGGIHRIAAAQALGLEQMFAYIVVWHPEANRERIVDRFGTGDSDHTPGRDSFTSQRRAVES